jgi:hypothetical protein
VPDVFTPDIIPLRRGGFLVGIYLLKLIRSTPIMSRRDKIFIAIDHPPEKRLVPEERNI